MFLFYLVDVHVVNSEDLLASLVPGLNVMNFLCINYFVFHIVKFQNIFKGICGDRILNSCLVAIGHLRLCKSISIGFLLLFFLNVCFPGLKNILQYIIFCKYCSWCNKVRWNALSNVPNTFFKISWFILVIGNDLS